MLLNINTFFNYILIVLVIKTNLVVTTGFIKSIKSIKSEDGELIDCIDIYKQPAFDHPLLTNHNIQMSPSYNPTKKTMRTEEEENNIMTLAVLVTGGEGYTGAKGDIMVWNPYVESDDEYSISHLSLKNGPSFDSSTAYEAVEAGWAVNPSLYGDNQTRLFAYWTVDSSNTTGCFDLTCPGFVQVDSEIALGAAIYPISQVGGPSYQIKFYIYKDPVTNNWWLKYGGKYDVGYWPEELFDPLSYGAKVVQWGGEVYSTKVQSTPHTATGMGSGQFTNPIPGNSGLVTGIEVERNSDEPIFPEWVAVYADEVSCYDVTYLSDYVKVPEFHYGGPGRCYRCP